MIKSTSFDHGESENLMSDVSQTSRPPTKELDIPFCGCLSVRYYQPYFDIDTVDITTRISHCVVFCNREGNFLSLIGDKPDAYGPVWIATTLVFLIAVASHLNGWFTSWMSGNIWEYNFQSIVSASSIVYGFVCGAPAAIWFVFKQIDPALKFVTIFCLYGYSLVIFAPAILICLVPSSAASWIALSTATVLSTVFLLRNLAPFVVSGAKKQAAVILSGVGCIQLGLMLSLKLLFFYDS